MFLWGQIKADICAFLISLCFLVLHFFFRTWSMHLIPDPVSHYWSFSIKVVPPWPRPAYSTTTTLLKQTWALDLFCHNDRLCMRTPHQIPSCSSVPNHAAMKKHLRSSICIESLFWILNMPGLNKVPLMMVWSRKLKAHVS